jgi:PAS domain S-box-containing protein
MVGHSRATLESGSMSWMNMTPPEYLGLDNEMVATLEEHGVIAPYEKEYFTADGRRVEVLVGAATLKGGSEGGVSFVLDISERRAAERALRARARQQTAVARFGELTLVSDGLASLFEDAVTLVADTLELPFSGVLERRADDTALLLRAGVGWSSTELGHTVVPISEDTQAGLTLLYNEPVILSDLAADRRFQKSAVMRAANIASGITVVIPGSVRPFGVLTAHDRRPRQFTRDDVHFLQAIAHVLGTAIERSRTDTALRQTQRLEAVGRLASGVSHDFNNVLAAIVAYAEIVHSGLHERDPMREDVSEILKAAGRATALTRQLMAFSRQQVLRPSMVRLNDVIAGLENMLQRLVGREIQFSTVLDPEIGWIKTDPGQIEQVIVNLCVNARDAMPDGGRLIVETANVELDDAKARAYSMGSPGSYVMLAVSDTGTGMDAETKARIFEPFFTTKESDKGTGLGLATVYGIVKQSGGESWVYSEMGHGTSFKIFLPRIDEQVSDDSVDDEIALAAGGTETILLAEDDDASFQIAMRLLEQEGYTVISARSGTEAARKADAYDGTIHLIVTDVVMRGLNGLQLAAHVRAQRSEARLLLVSGYTDAAVSQLGPMPEGARFLQKPFTPEALAREVRVALDASDGRAASTATF